MRKAASSATPVLALAAFAATGAVAQDNSRFDIPRTANAPVIDGRVGPAEWAGAARVPVDIEYEPADNLPADVRAEANTISEVDTWKCLHGN